MKRTERRIETLENERDKTIFPNYWQVAAAYYLGGAKRPDDVMGGYVRALGYASPLEDFARDFAALITGQSMEIRLRARNAQRRLLTRFYPNVNRGRPTKTADKLYEIVRMMPRPWVKWIRSAEAQERDLQARADEIWDQLLEIAAKSKRAP